MNDFLTNPKIRELFKHRDIIVAMMVLFVVGSIIIPLPAILLDLLLGLNIGLAVIILLLSIFTKRVLDFSVFPTLLLVTTLFRLALNVSSTRLILSTGDPGEVVTAFGEFVTQGDMVVGAVIFLILIIVQFLVITNGSTRVAEVSARFALDAMPQKQMAIDGDLSNGLIDEATAKRRREETQIEAEFYGSMDGASKFVKGDAIAGLIVVVINFVGGIIIFMMKGYEVMDAVEKFGTLTIGDGLVSQVPALLISVASGIIVTRTPSENNLGHELSDQLFSMPKTILMTSVITGIFAIMPGLPFLPFMVVSAISGLGGWLLHEDEKQKKRIEHENPLVEDTPVEQTAPADDMTQYLQLESFEVEFGYSIVEMVDQKNGSKFMERVLQVRRQVIQELGIIVPPIRLKDNVQLDANTYAIKIKGLTIGTGVIYPGRYLIMNPEDEVIDLPGIDTIEPSFGMKAKWIEESLKGRAEKLHYTAVDDSTVLITHIKEVVKNNAHDLLGRQELKTMLDALKVQQPSIVEDLIPDLLSLGETLKVLKNLLRENVSIRDLGTILETLADNATRTKDTELLTEFVRTGLQRQLVLPYLTDSNELYAVALDGTVDNLIASHLKSTHHGTFPAISPEITSRILYSVQLKLDECFREQKMPVLLVSPSIRPAFRKLTELNFPMIPVLSLNEVPNYVIVKVLRTVNLND